jgi:Uma2 family endonuclease
MAPQTSIRLTYEDYCAIPDDGRRHEIIDGEHYVNPSPATLHQLVSMRLASALHAYVTANKLGYVFAAPFDVILGEHDIVEPDIIYVDNARAAIITKKNIQGIPNLLIEIVSDSHPEYDKRLKYQLYERHRVPEYWIVEPEQKTISIYRHSGSAFAASLAGETLMCPQLPGFALPLEPLFAPPVL